MIWPWPGDAPLDRARRIALSYRESLLERFPDAAMDLDEKFRAWGEHWVTPAAEHVDLEEWVTVDVAADLVGFAAKTVYGWVYQKRLTGKHCNDGRVRVKVLDAIDVGREIRQRRAERNTGKAA